MVGGEVCGETPNFFVSSLGCLARQRTTDRDEMHGVLNFRRDRNDDERENRAGRVARRGIDLRMLRQRSFVDKHQAERLAILAQAQFGGPMVVGGGILRHVHSLSLEAAT